MHSLSRNQDFGALNEWMHLRTARRLMLMYKFYEMEVQKSFDEHRANHNLAEPSVNYDHMSILFLSRELEEITRQHRALRILAGLTPLAPETSIQGDAANVDLPQITWSEASALLLTLSNHSLSVHPKFLALEFSTQEQVDAIESAQRKEQIDEVLRNVVNIEGTADETGEYQTQSNEHHAHEDQLGETQSSLQQEQPAPEQEDQPHNSTVHSNSRSSSFHLSVHNEKSDSLCFIMLLLRVPGAKRYRIAYSDLMLVNEICLAGVSRCELLLEEVSDGQWSRFDQMSTLVNVFTGDLYPYFRRLLSFYAAVGARLVAPSSSSLGLSIDTSLETGVAGFEEHEVVTVFVCLRDCGPVVLLFFNNFGFELVVASVEFIMKLLGL
ncbi:hypothetical protein F511_36256 [Dorcoceras hygrometricum]|uniref:Uncharacterized protein n=1 Tax=Dorcoceras hygrometricum TaxID=472368 RepID=A0A2Z7CIV3_9LAMI|nr:hypothetical protein F511_36256 [Dorcoceras hygrometricum]